MKNRQPENIEEKEEQLKIWKEWIILRLIKQKCQMEITNCNQQGESSYEKYIL